MKKNGVRQRRQRCRALKKMLMIMKLTTLLIFTALVQVSAISYSQQTKLNMKFENETLESIFSKIEKNSEFSIFYKNELLQNASSKSGDFKNARIFDILDDILANEGLTYSIKGKIIMIVPDDSNTSAISQLQQKAVSGTVTDESGSPLPGVTVIIKGTTNGTVTNAYGEYSLSNVPGDATLLFSFVGMKMQEILVAGKTSINVTMVEETIGIDEVVAVGYGTVRKADLTGSVASVQGEDLENRKSAVTITNVLQGTMPGVRVTRSNSEPGTTGTVRIRGITTIGDSTPLVIIDGVPGDLSYVSPSEIESISVLKDAASASIYGSKAAAGVILVTTKRGKSGQFGLQYNIQYGYDQPTQLPKNERAVSYMKLANELVWNDNGNVGSEFSTYSEELIKNYPELHANSPNEYPDTDWRQYIRDFSPRQSHVMSFSSGGEKYSSYGSFSYDNVQSIIDDRPYDKFSVRLNNDINPNKYISAHFDIDYKYTHDQRKQTTPSASLLCYEPTERAYWTDGRVADFRNGENMIARLIDGGDYHRWDNVVNGKIGLDIMPLKGLKISGIFAPKFSFLKRKNHWLKIPMTAWDDPETITGYVQGSTSTTLTEYRIDSKAFTTQFILNYLKTFGKHNLNFVAGYEHYYYYYEYLMAQRSHYELDNYPYLDLGPEDYQDNSGYAYEYASRSYFGRFNYSYNNKYLFQFNARYDGSSRFHEDHRWGLFPSVSTGWVISEESFMDNISSIVSFLKLRASYGSLGNERIGSYYPYQSSIAYSYALFYSGTSATTSQTAYIPRYAVENITWETTTSCNIGFNATLFDNSLQVEADFYKKKTKDMLLDIEIPSYIGFENPERNSGEMYTTGWELQLSYRNNIKDLRYSITANLSDAKSVMGNLDGTEFLGSQASFEGSEYNEWYGYLSDGIYQSEEEIENSATLYSNVKPGDVKYVDVSGPDGVPDGTISSTYDRVLLGGSLPRYDYGGNIRLDYKNFDFSLFFQGVGKRRSYLSSSMVQPLRSGVLAVPHFLMGKYWSEYNTEKENLNAIYPRLSQSSSSNNYSTSDFWLFDGGYFRLKNIVLGYSLSEGISKKIGMESIRFYVNLSDLFSIDKYPKGYDPEGSTSGYFVTRTLLLGATIKF